MIAKFQRSKFCKKILLFFTVLLAVIITFFILLTNTQQDGAGVFRAIEGIEAAKAKLQGGILRMTSPTASSFTEIGQSVKARLLSSEESYQLYVKKRKASMPSKPEDVDPWSGVYFWEYFLPTFSCPYSIDRVGRLGDGGKFVCGLELFKAQLLDGRNNDPCIIYSFGVGGTSDYEAEMLERTNCEIYAYDASTSEMGPQVSKTEPRIHFHKMYIGAENTDTSLTLKSILKNNGHDWIDFVKMDIERSEIAVLHQIMEDFDILPFGQLAVELHGDDKGDLFPNMHTLWQRMEDHGLRSFKNEVNSALCVHEKGRPSLYEYSFLNSKGDHRIINPRRFH